MTGLSLHNIEELCGGIYHGPAEAEELCPNELVIDSRKVVPGNLFAALPGEKVDGHSFVGKALDAGAAACLVTHIPEGETRPLVIVPDVAKAMGAIAKAYRKTLNIPIIGVTGSVGKTTMKEMIACVLGSRYEVLKTEKNFNNDLGVPMTVSRINPEHKAAVIELGISHFGEMAGLADIVRPTMAVYTNIGYSHLEALGDRNGVLKEKSVMLDYMPAIGTAFFNGDDDLLARDVTRLETVTFGTEDYCDVRAENISMDGRETHCDIVCGDRRFPVEIHAYGKHMVTAAVGAAAIGMSVGLSDADIRAGIAAYAPVGGRAAVKDTGYITLINDCYNANLDSMGAALESLSMLPGWKVAILGDMYELGPGSPKMHRAMGEKAAALGVDGVIAVGALGKDIAAGHGNSLYFETKEALIAELPKLIPQGATVLVKASHGLHLEAVVEALEELK